jgi:hypothetical protein
MILVFIVDVLDIYVFMC